MIEMSRLRNLKKASKTMVQKNQDDSVIKVFQMKEGELKTLKKTPRF